MIKHLVSILIISCILFCNTSVFAEIDDDFHYIQYALLTKKPIIWKKSNINVFIHSPNSSEYRKMFYLWQEALNNKIVFSFVKEEYAADIVVSFSDDVSSMKYGTEGFICAQNNLSFRKDSIYKAKIFLFKKNPKTNKIFSENEILAYLLHEIGHVLGITSHSPNKNDIMYYSPDVNLILSVRDINTIKLLYSELENISFERANDYRKKIIKFYRKEMPNDSLFLIEIGNYYRHDEKYRKAISFYKKAIKLDPTNIHNYYPMCICHYKMKKYNKAYDCFEYLVENDSNNLQYLHALSIIAKKINKKEKITKKMEEFVQNNSNYDFDLVEEIKEKIKN